ncbi:MAG: hypothetical protein K0V04_00435 [Deltaproteobacteria bacterium]|nr:hypothetical protein [Deltaproteobacteria bacterium]
MAPDNGMFPSGSASASSTTPHQTSGNALTFRVDANASVLELVLDDGSRVDLWDRGLVFVFAPQQQTVALTFCPVGSSYAIAGTRTNANTSQSTLAHSGNDAVDAVTRPAAGTTNTMSYDCHHVAPRSNATPGQEAVFKLVKSKLVFTTAESSADPDVAPGLTH